jgi:hypothetical protein
MGVLGSSCLNQRTWETPWLLPNVLKKNKDHENFTNAVDDALGIVSVEQPS